jgi:hypothetical protein
MIAEYYQNNFLFGPLVMFAERHGRHGWPTLFPSTTSHERAEQQNTGGGTSDAAP